MFRKRLIYVLIFIIISTGAICVYKGTRTSGKEKQGAAIEAPLPSTVPVGTQALSKQNAIPLAIDIPEGAGHVVEGYKSNKEGAKIVLHIQDIHTNYQAQKNLSRIIEALVEENSLKLIMVEGGWGNVSLSYLRSYADKERRLEVAEEYLKSGKISGEEYLDIISDYDISLEGLEKEELYKANLDTFFEIEQFRKKADTQLQGINRVVKALKQKSYPARLVELEKAEQDYEDAKISLADYYKYLDYLAKKTGQNPAAYPYFKRFIDVTELEKKIKFPVVEKERSALIEKLSGKLSKQKLAALVTKSLEFRLNKMTPSEYHEYLVEEAGRAGEEITEYPNLKRYIEYIRAHEDIDTTALFEEADALSAAIKNTLLTSQQQKRLYRISRSINVLDNFLNLKLVPNDFKYYMRNRNDFNTAGWMEFLQAQAEGYNVRTAPLKPAYTLDKNLATLVKFYDIANKRDDVFVQNAIKLMNEQEQDLGVLIAGGFHTPSLKQKLKECGLSYIVIAPHTTQETDPEQYRYILRYKSGKEE